MRQTEFDQPAFLARLRNGDPAAYRALIRRFHTSLTGVASSVIGSHAQAEEVVQDAWLAVFSGIGRFEGRSSLTTWIFSIVLNRARTRAGRERRLVGLPGILDGATPGERAVPASAFRPDGHWVDEPKLWDEISPERIVGGRQLWDHVLEVIDRLPAGQRAVIILRDMEGQDAEETCRLLEISAENQRVLLHRARTRIRQAIDGLVNAGKRVAAGDRAPRPRRVSGLARVAAGLARIGDRAAAWPAAILRAVLLGRTGIVLRRRADQGRRSGNSLATLAGR
jgi:RNA polymerase sigma-70 factor, ECF subfamily